MMVGDGWVRIPVVVQDIIPLGIGSAKISADGKIEITLPNSVHFGRAVYKDALEGFIKSLSLKAVVTPAERKIDGQEHA